MGMLSATRGQYTVPLDSVLPAAVSVPLCVFTLTGAAPAAAEWTEADARGQVPPVPDRPPAVPANHSALVARGAPVVVPDADTVAPRASLFRPVAKGLAGQWVDGGGAVDTRCSSPPLTCWTCLYLGRRWRRSMA